MKRLAGNFRARSSMKRSRDFKCATFFDRNGVNLLNPLSLIIHHSPYYSYLGHRTILTPMSGKNHQGLDVEEIRKKRRTGKKIQNKSPPDGSAASLGDATCHTKFPRSDFNVFTADRPNHDGFVLQRTIPVTFGYPLVCPTYANKINRIETNFWGK